MNPERRERLPVSVSSAVFIEDEQGRLLLLQQASERKKFRWGPPGGGLESHEDPMMCALREVREEIGAEAELTNLIGIYSIDKGDNTTGIGFVFRGRIAEGEIVLNEGEIKDARFFAPDEIRQLILEDMLYKPEYNLLAIEDWFNGQSFPIEAIRSLAR